VLARDEAQRTGSRASSTISWDDTHLRRALAVHAETCWKIFAQIAPPRRNAWESAGLRTAPETVAVTKGDVIFPRIDLEKELAALAAQQ
jgi:hypothetical protein